MGPIAGWIARGRAAFPALAPLVDDAIATAWFEARVADQAEVPAEDLYLACACSLGSDAAVEAFASRHLPRLRGPLRHAGLDDAAIAEVEQALVALVFVGDGDPHILRYSGRGSLQRWLESIAVRMALRRRERDLRHDSDDALADLAAPDQPRAREHAGALRIAFTEAMAALSPRERTLLRQHHLDGVSLEALAAAHRVHRATVARWLAAAREAVAAKTREALAREVGLATAEIDSLVRSQLDLSIRRHLHD